MIYHVDEKVFNISNYCINPQIKYCPILINDDSFILLHDDITFTKNCMTKVFGSEMSDTIYDLAKKMNSLNLTTTEMSLLIPFLVTSDGKH